MTVGWQTPDKANVFAGKNENESNDTDSDRRAFKMSTIARTPACHHNRPQESLPPSGRDTILQLSEGAAISEVLWPADHLSCSVEMRLRESPTSWITWPLLLWSS